MKTLSIAGAALALLLTGALAAGCGVTNYPVEMLGAQALKDDCTVDSGSYITRGTLNVANGGAYIAQFEVISHVQELITKIGDDTISDTNNADAFFDRAVIAYTVGTNAMPAESVAIHAVFKAGATDGSFIRMNLMTPKMADQLTTLQTAGAASQSLLVSVHLEGKLYGSGSRDLVTNTVTFPITLSNVPFPGCATGFHQVAIPSTCGSVAQDGGGYGCEVDEATP